MVLERFRTGSSRSVATSMVKQTLRERSPDKPARNQLEYKEAIWSLQYRAMILRLDIGYTVGRFAKYANNLLLID